MVDYPSLPINADDYSIEPSDGSQSTRADDGTLRIRRLYAAISYQIRITHPYLSPAEFAELETFYLTYRSAPVRWTDPLTGFVYEALMLGPPKHTHVNGGTHLDVSMEMEGRRG